MPPMVTALKEGKVDHCGKLMLATACGLSTAGLPFSVLLLASLCPVPNLVSTSPPPQTTLFLPFSLAAYCSIVVRMAEHLFW
jgi:hypothetical protein